MMGDGGGKCFMKWENGDPRLRENREYMALFAGL
jgi:hypothetical protein